MEGDDLFCLLPTEYFKAILFYRDIVGDISEFYREYHGAVSRAICTVGLLSNAAIIAVLMRRVMRHSLINKMLTAIAGWDMLLMALDLAFKSVDGCSPVRWTYAWTVFSVLYANVGPVAHTSSLWLTVLMAAIRWLIVRKQHGNSSSSWLNSSSAAVVYIVSTFVFVTAVNVPNMLRNQVQSFGPVYLPTGCGGHVNQTTKRLVFFVGKPDWWNCNWEKTNFFIAGLFFKILPCILLTVFVTVLVLILMTARRRRRALRSGVATRLYTDRTTALLIVIVSVFLVTELPQGLLVAAIAVRPTVYVLYRLHLSEMIDLLSLVNSCVNFILYCAMSSQFRREFLLVFGMKRLLGDELANWTTTLPDVVIGSIRSRTNTWTGNTQAARHARQSLKRLVDDSAGPLTRLSLAPTTAVRGYSLASNAPHMSGEGHSNYSATLQPILPVRAHSIQWSDLQSTHHSETVCKSAAV